jgi:hypothetical protein
MTLIADKIFHHLREHPWILAVVIVNVLFLGYVVHVVAETGERRDQLIAELARNCKTN